MYLLMTVYVASSAFMPGVTGHTDISILCTCQNLENWSCTFQRTVPMRNKNYSWPIVSLLPSHLLVSRDRRKESVGSKVGCLSKLRSQGFPLDLLLIHLPQSNGDNKPLPYRATVSQTSITM